MKIGKYALRFRSQSQRLQFERISKAQWFALFRDLYAQTHGEVNADFYEVDAKNRLKILQKNGIV